MKFSPFTRVASMMALAWFVFVLGPDLVWRLLDPESVMSWRMRGTYLAVMASSCVIWVSAGISLAQLRATHRRLGALLCVVFALVAAICALGTVLYQLYFDYTPRPLIFSFLLQNFGYLAALMLSSIGSTRLALFVCAPFILLAWILFATRRPASPLPAVPVRVLVPLAALFVPVLTFLLPGRLSSVPPDFVGLRVALVGTRLWASDVDLPMLPIPKRVTPKPRPVTAAPSALILIHESIGTRQVAPWSGGSSGAAANFAGFLASHGDRTAWFSRATTVAPHTNVAFPAILSGIDPGASNSSYRRAPLVWHDARALGYRTALVSAQDFKFSLFREFFLGDDRPDVTKTAPDLSSQRTIDSGVDDALAADEIIKFIQGTPHDQPFLATVQFSGSHFPCWDPNNPTDQLVDIMDDRRRQERCARAIDHIDRQVARILEELRTNGRLANTIVVSTADHGEVFDPARPRRPVNFYEDTLNVPLAIALPASVIAKRPDVMNHLQANRHRLVSNMDIFPTLLDLWGQWPIDSGNVRPPLAGMSLLRDIPDDRSLVSTARSNISEPFVEGFALYHGRWKWLFDEKRGLQLHDLDTDGGELVDTSKTAPRSEVEFFLKSFDADKRLRTALASNSQAMAMVQAMRQR